MNDGVTDVRPSALRQPSWLPWLPAELWEALDEEERLAVLEGRLGEAEFHDLVHALGGEEESAA